MPQKLKTHQATSKRLHRTGKNKLMKRKAGQNHFNSRDRGEATMNKRRDIGLYPADEKNAKRLLPYS